MPEHSHLFDISSRDTINHTNTAVHSMSGPRNLYLYTPKASHFLILNTLKTLFCNETQDFMIFCELMLLDCYDKFWKFCAGHFARRQKTEKICSKWPENQKTEIPPVSDPYV